MLDNILCQILKKMELKSERWKRPDSVQFPSVWSRFDGRKEINGTIPKFWIQDIPEEQFEDVINIMAERFLNDEPLSKYARITSDKESVTVMKNIWRDVLNDKVGLICYMENPDSKEQPIIAAVNCTHVVCKNDPKTEVKAKKAAKILNVFNYLTKDRDFFQEFNVDHYLNAMGLYVFPKFRGQGLGLELLKAREPLCKAVGIPMTITIFTAIASQIIAARAGFKELTAADYAKISEECPDKRIEGVEEHTKGAKYMYIVY